MIARRSPSRGAVLAGCLAVAVAIGLAGAPAALAAAPLTYGCTFPLIGSQQIAVAIVVPLRDGTVGVPNSVIGVTATVSVPESIHSSLKVVGAATIEGTAGASATVTDGAGTSQTVSNDTLTIPRTALPARGPVDVVATGDFTDVTIANPGTVTVTAPSRFTTTLTPRTGSGGTTLLGTFTSTCTVVAGQDLTIGTAEVTAP